MRVLGLLLVLLLLSLPTWATASPGDARSALTASEVTWTGSGALTASVSGAVLDNATMAPNTALGIVLNVESGQLELDTTRIAIHAGGAGLTPTNNTESTTPLNHTAFREFLSSTNCRILVIPMAGSAAFDATTPSGTLLPSTFGSKTYRSSGYKEHSGLTINAVKSSAVAAQSMATIQAPLLIVVWGANFTMDDGHAATTVRTGEFDEPVDGNLIPQQLAQKHAIQEAYVTISKGNLTIPLGQQFRVFLASSHLEVQDGKLLLENPRGILPVDGKPLPQDAHALSFTAPLEADVLAENQVTLQVLLPQPPNSADLDGVIVRTPNSPPWLLFLGLAALVALPAGATAASQYRLRRHLRGLDASVRERRFGDALAIAQTIRRWRPRNAEALVGETLSLLQTKRYQEASGVLESPGWPLSLVPMRDYLRAMAAAGQERRAEALRWLRKCLQEAPDLSSEAEANPLLAGLLADVERPRKGGPGRHDLPGTP